MKVYDMRLSLLALSCFMMLWTWQGASAGVDWAKAPPACLPDRAERWNDVKNRKLCYCPPKSFCPGPVALQLNQVRVNVALSFIPPGGGAVANRNFTIPAIDALQNGQNINNIQQLFAEMAKGNYKRFADGYAGGTEEITPVVDAPEAMERWLNELRMPQALVSRCCDAICPPGFNVEFQRKLVNETSEPPDYDALDLIYDNNGLLKLNDKEQLVFKDGTILTFENVGDFEDKFDPDQFDKLVDYLKNKAINDGTGETSRQVWKTTFTCKPIITRRAYGREGCILEGTLITMMDGSTRAIEELELGDIVMGSGGPAKVTSLSKFTQERDKMYSINGKGAFFTVEHPILTKDGWKALDSSITSVKSGVTILGDLQIGDMIVLADGTLEEVRTIEEQELENGVDAYNIALQDNKSFYANGLVLKSFHKMQMHY